MFKKFFCLFLLRYQGLGCHYMPYRHEMYKHSVQRSCQNGLFWSKLWLNITNRCLKWSSRYIIIASWHFFKDLFVYARTAAFRTQMCINISNGKDRFTYRIRWTYYIDAYHWMCIKSYKWCMAFCWRHLYSNFSMRGTSRLQLIRRDHKNVLWVKQR